MTLHLDDTTLFSLRFLFFFLRAALASGGAKNTVMIYILPGIACSARAAAYLLALRPIILATQWCKSVCTVYQKIPFFTTAMERHLFR